MTKNFRHTLIAAITFFSGLYFFLEYMLPENIAGYEFGKYHDQISFGFITVGVMAIGLGVINIFRVHGGAIIKARKGWGNSLALLLGLAVMFFVEGGDFLYSIEKVESWQKVANLSDFSIKVFSERDRGNALERVRAIFGVLETVEAEARSDAGYLSTGNISDRVLVEQFLGSLSGLRNRSVELISLYQSGEGEAELEQGHQAFEAAVSAASEQAKDVSKINYEQSTSQQAMQLLRKGFFFPLGAAMFSLLAFYIAAAAHRSFRVRSLEALIMMVFAVLVILGQIPHGPMYVWDGLPQLRLWLLENISTPAFRAIFFGSAIAGLAMAVRMWLSLERSPLSTDEDA